MGSNLAFSHSHVVGVDLCLPKDMLNSTRGTCEWNLI